MAEKDWLDELIAESLEKAVWGAFNKDNIDRVRRKNLSKTHFIPLGVRVFSGVVQAMNIRYGNFIQVLLNALVARETSLQIHAESGRRIDFLVPGVVDAVVDSYIAQRKRSSDDDASGDYHAMRESWEVAARTNIIQAPNDVDLLFRDSNGRLTYVELKFNDDHDTGKHPDIFRKVIKTGLAIEVRVDEPVYPCVYFFNPGERNLVRFLPDGQRFFGEAFFERYLTVEYKTVAAALANVSNRSDVKAKFVKFFYETVGNSEGEVEE